ncbi:MAG: hypothetical protein ACRDZ4_07705 [Egibacteraceae bacterium]
MRKGMRVQLTAAIALILLMAVACGRDDGAAVRTIDEGTGAASGPGTGSGPGTASVPRTDSTPGASGSASGPGAAALDPAKADTRVSVTLREWTVTPQPAEVKAGVIAFDVKNEGGTKHELVVLRAADAQALPVKPDGAADEDKLPAGDAIGEVEVEVGKTGVVAFQLTPGDYVLICNIVDDTATAHFKQGMHVSFKVT